jgi:putative addiction module component (TIGR02574 family)
MILDQHPELRRLSPADKLALVSELWDDLAAHPEHVPVAPELIVELDRRMEAYRKDPTQVTTWEAVKARLLGGGAANAA